MKLSIIIPAYNEGGSERNFKYTLESYYNYLEKSFPDFDMGIITNNCSDDTPKITSQFIKKHPKAWWHEIKGYSGKGGAVMRGFDIAQGEWVAFVDADNSITVKEFFRAFKKVSRNKKYDGIITSRRFPGAKIIPPRGFTQNISSRLFNMITNCLFRLGYYDTQCGCKIFSKECTKYISKNCSETGWNFDVNILHLCKKKRFKIKEFPIIWSDTAGGKVSTWDGIKAVFGLFKYRFKIQ